MFCIIIYKKQYNSTKNNRFFKKKANGLTPQASLPFAKVFLPEFFPRLSIHRHGVVVMNWSTDDVLKDGGPLSDGVKV